MAYDSSNYNYPESGQVQYTTDHNHSDPPKPRPRASSTVRAGDAEYPRPSAPARHAQPPIDEAVSSAVDKADMHYVNPDLVAQITENVMKQLKIGIDGATPVPQHKPFAPPLHQPAPQSPSTLESASPPSTHHRNVYTPPSPHKQSDYPRHGSPDLPPYAASQRSRTPPPIDKERRTSSPNSAHDESGYTRPKGPARLSTGRDETTLEKIWGQLFDEDSNPTPRLSHFLRGLAMHIIEDYEPHNSLVITPKKMQKYYEDVKLEKEPYPWSAILDHEKSSISRMYRELSCQHHLVQVDDGERPVIPGLTPIGFERWVTLLIRAHPDEEYSRLQKAVLTMPISNPEDRKERFPKEISRRLFPTIGDRKVRQRLDDAICEHAQVDLPKRTKVDSPGFTTDTIAEPEELPPPNRRDPAGLRVDTEAKPSTNFYPSPLEERDRAPYSNVPSEAIIDNTNPFPPSLAKPIERARKPYAAVPGAGKAFDDEVPIERERKPYAAVPGAGKAFDDEVPIERERKPYTAVPGGGKAFDDEWSVKERKTYGAQPGGGKVFEDEWKPPRSESTTDNVGRSSSTAKPRTSTLSGNSSRPIDVIKPEIHNPTWTNNNGRRRRSPSFSKTDPFRRSDSDVRTHPLPFHGSNAAAGEVLQDDHTRYPRERTDRPRRQADDDGRIHVEDPPTRARYEHGPLRGSYIGAEEDYYRSNGRHVTGSGYDYAHHPSYGGPVYR